MSTGGTSLSKFAAEVTAASHNPGVSAILVHVDSGGGSAIGSEAAHRALADAGTRVHTVALIEGTAGSAALWVAGAAKEIVAVPGSMVGSIGCFAVHENVDLTKIGVKPTVVSSEKKVQFSPYLKLTEAAKGDLQAQVDGVARRFMADLARARGVPVAKVETWGGGGMLTAVEARVKGLVDRIEPASTTMARVMKMKRGVATPVGMRAEATPSLAANADFRLRRHNARMRHARMIGVR